MRSGAGAWSGASYDFARDQVLFGTGNSYAVSTLLGKNPRNRSAALYSNSTLKLDARSGRIVWYNQHFPGDVWDEDWAYERTIIKDPRGSNRPVVVNIGKLGILDALDLETGRYLWSTDMGFQDLVTHIDPRSGAKTVDEAKLPATGQSVDVCPFAGGVRNWPATSYDPDRSLMFVSTLDACMKFSIHSASQSHSSQSQQASWTVKFRSGSDHQLGGLMAIDMRTGKVAWAVRHRADPASAMLATQGGLIFAGTRDRWFRARDVDTGNTLWGGSAHRHTELVSDHLHGRWETVCRRGHRWRHVSRRIRQSLDSGNRALAGQDSPMGIRTGGGTLGLSSVYQRERLRPALATTACACLR
jgi:glucose dehydrogenase